METQPQNATESRPQNSKLVPGARWVRERNVGSIGKWHRPAVWPTATPDALVSTMCGREIVIDCSASVPGGGVLHPPCPDCAP